MSHFSSPYYPVDANQAAMPGQRTPDVRGLTKREYFAAQALQGLLAQSGALAVNSQWLAGLAVLYADYLIDALNRPPIEKEDSPPSGGGGL